MWLFKKHHAKLNFSWWVHKHHHENCFL
jgi:hypothetical protein